MFEGDRGLRVGTSSWSSRDWLGVFYPKGTPSNRYIEHYATIFDTVEIDATFYHMPSEDTVRAWRDRTPEHFLFSSKVPRTITHDKVLTGDSGEEMLNFIEVMSGLGTRRGPHLLQFPYFNRKRFPGPGPFLERLDSFLAGLPGDVPLAVEVRNRQWVGRDLHEVCSRHGVALAWVDQAWMPFAREWVQRVEGPSAGFAYLRFLGDHKAIEEITTTWEKTVIDRTRELEAWIPVIQDLRRQGADVFAYFNNHFASHAPATIELFRELWRAADPAPPSLPGEEGA